jgi:hypothetical protein
MWAKKATSDGQSHALNIVHVNVELPQISLYRLIHYPLEAKIPGIVVHRSLRNTPEYPTMDVDFIYNSLHWHFSRHPWSDSPLIPPEIGDNGSSLTQRDDPLGLTIICGHMGTLAMYRKVEQCWQSSFYIRHISTVTKFFQHPTTVLSLQQPCTGLSLSLPSRSSELPALSRSAQSLPRPTLSSPGRLALAPVVPAAQPSKVPLCSTPTGGGPTSLADTPTATMATPGTPLLALTVLLALRTARLTELTTRVISPLPNILFITLTTFRYLWYQH